MFGIVSQLFVTAGLMVISGVVAVVQLWTYLRLHRRSAKFGVSVPWHGGGERFAAGEIERVTVFDSESFHLTNVRLGDFWNLRLVWHKRAARHS